MNDVFGPLTDVLAPRRVLLGEPEGDGWVRCDALLADDGRLLDLWLELAGSVYGNRDVAGSFLFWWYVADVVRPAVLALVTRSVTVDLAPERTWLHVAPEGWPDAVVYAGSTEASPDPVAALAEEVIRHLEPLVDAVRTRIRLGPVAMWGAAAAHVAEAFVDGCRFAGRPGAARREAERFFAACPPMRAVPTWFEFEGPTGPVAACRRRVCCLAYKLPDETYCGDCPLTPRVAWEAGVLAEHGTA